MPFMQKFGKKKKMFLQNTSTLIFPQVVCSVRRMIHDSCWTSCILSTDMMSGAEGPNMNVYNVYKSNGKSYIIYIYTNPIPEKLGHCTNCE